MFPRRAFLVSHTHWDREWYLTYHQFRVRLGLLVGSILDRLTEGGEFRHFLLDGQAILLEDFLAIHPEEAGRIRRLVDAGALSIGPWYILPDEFLVSGEATVRNLLIGDAACRPLGGAQREGYMPDSFGHLAQMPQLLRGAGIESFIYTRGHGDEIEDLGSEYLWEAPDGSRVLAINQVRGYCNAGGLGFEEIWHAHTPREVDVRRAVEQVRELFAAMEPRARGDVVLLNNGCDHFPPQQAFSEILGALREAFPDTEFIHTDLSAFVAAVRASGEALRVHRGELRQGREHPILSGVWSARMYLKQRNSAAQDLLAGLLEPLASYAHCLYGQAYPAGELTAAWKLLLQNHPHDSICGCSIDPVHREMEIRFAGVQEAGEALIRAHLEGLVPTFARRGEDDDQTVLVVFNALSQRRSEVVTRLVVLPQGVLLDELALYDATGSVVPCEILAETYVERFWNVDYRGELFGERQRRLFDSYCTYFGERIIRTREERDTSDGMVRLQFLARDLPPVGHACFYLKPKQTSTAVAPPSTEVTATGDAIANEFYVVRLSSDGTIELHDKATGRTFSGLHRIADCADIGDEYDFSPSAEPGEIGPENFTGKVRIVRATPWCAEIEVAGELKLPRAILPDRRRRASEMIDLPLKTRVRLQHRSPLIEIETRIENHARDHRLRIEFPLPIATDEVISDGQFLISARPIEQPTGEGWVQPPADSLPQQEFSALEDGSRGFALLNRGLPEISARRGVPGETILALTLLRCVEWLSRDDFPTRNFANAGPTLHTPDAQCMGEHCFEYALVPYAGDHITAGIKALARRYRTPLVTRQGVADNHIAGGSGLLETGSREVVVEAIKRAEASDHLIVRLCNLTSGPVRERLTFGRPIRAAWRTNLLEARSESFELDSDRELEVALGPHAIVTVEIDLATVI